MRASSTYSSIVVPQMLTKTMARRSRSSGSFSRMKRWTPMPCSPIALSIPDGVSTIRGGGCPSRSARNRPLTATPPSVDEIDHVAVLDAVAEAAAGGDQRVGERGASRWKPTDPCQCASASQTIRRESNTGPSRQDRTKCGAPAVSFASAPRSCSSRRDRNPSPARARRRRPAVVSASRATARIIGVGPHT